MSLKDIKEKHAQEISLLEYNNAKQSMSEEEFKKSYYLGYNGCYRRDFTDSEYQIIILDKILGWIKFFGMLIIISLIAWIILTLI